MKKFFATLLGILLVTSAGTWVAFTLWRSALKESVSAGAELIETQFGAVEYASRGDGPVLLVLHGTPGGYDQVFSGTLYPHEYRLLAISRPGYLRTPLASGKTPAEQADLVAALLDKLGVNRVQIMGVSGGGFAALQFALRHPDRTRALILLSARSQPHPVIDGEPSLTDRLREIVGTDFLIWVLGNRIARSFAGDEPVDDETLARLRTVVNSSALMGERAEGRANDVANSVNPAIASWPLAHITVPTLIVYGRNDPGKSPEDSEHAHEQIPNSKLVVMDGGHFIGATHPDEVRQEVEAFLNPL